MVLQNPLYLFPTVKQSLALACGRYGNRMNLEKGLQMNPMTNCIIIRAIKNGTPMVTKRNGIPKGPRISSIRKGNRCDGGDIYWSGS